MSNNGHTFVRFDELSLPIYDGLESAYEDVVYAFLRNLLEERGYSLRVKRSGFPEIDSVIRSGKTAAHGRGSCDAYVISGRSFEGFYGLIELESTGKLDLGIAQIKDYAASFNASTLGDDQRAALQRLNYTELLLIVFDGQLLWLAKYDLKTSELTVEIDKARVSADSMGVSSKLYAHFPARETTPAGVDEKALITSISNLLRGHEALQRRKALVMTVLASIYGATQNAVLGEAIATLQQSGDKFDERIQRSHDELVKDLALGDRELLSRLYSQTAPKLYSLSQEKGMDLYGYIYEELATKDAKKEQGEYYTPRHVIRPLLAAVQREYLRWTSDELDKKVVFDPFCGSGGFLYEFIRMHKATYDLTRERVDEIASTALFGTDKNSIRGAYLNLYLIGDGSANLEQVRTSLNWRNALLYETVSTKGNRLASKRLADEQALTTSYKRSQRDLEYLVPLLADVKVNESLRKATIDAAKAGESNPLESAVLKSLGPGSSRAALGNVDLLVTNVPYGKISDPTEQVVDDGTSPYGMSLEANAVRECVDFLRPAELENGKIVRKGGIAIMIVPDSILENPTNEAIRKYLIARCDVLAVVSLPPFTFSPYAMEKTYAIVVRKIAPEQFDSERDLTGHKSFMYYSLADGKANSVNRYPTLHLKKTPIKLNGGKAREVVEYWHNDFDPGFDTYVDDRTEYLSKMERAWMQQTAALNSAWDQERVTDVWTGTGWAVEPGRKWGHFEILREQRASREPLRRKQLIDVIVRECAESLAEAEVGTALDLADVAEAIGGVSLNAASREALARVSAIEVVDSDGEKSIALYTEVTRDDIVLNPNDSRYLGPTRGLHRIVDVLADLKALPELTADAVVQYFSGIFDIGDAEEAVSFRLSDEYHVLQGVQFSKEDAYNWPGDVPVFTAATDGPAYLCGGNVPGKTRVKGPGLIWSRKGAKAGTIQLFDPRSSSGECYITDVSGIIKQKSEVLADWTYLQYFIAGQVKSEIQAQDNNSQLNKSRLEALRVIVPREHKEIGQFLRGVGL